MSEWNRRHVLTGLSGLTLAPLIVSESMAKNSQLARIVIIGGGFGGATAAMTLKTLSPNLNVTLIEPKKSYYACPFSNLVIGGQRDGRAQEFTYTGLKSIGVDVIPVRADDIDINNKRITLKDGYALSYDKLILSPGITMRMDAIEGYDSDTEKRMPHAWTGGRQTEQLAANIVTMRDGGTIVISVPPAPYRCPPGPYERASLIAHYLKNNKPKSKLIILDSKDVFSKQALFQKAWAENYKGILEWRGASDDGRVVRINSRTSQIFTDFEALKVDIANIIPPQKAGFIAERAGVTDSSGWCPVNPIDFSSTLQKNVYVLGDATIAAPMPKSAFSAAVHAKICSIQILRELSGLDPQATTLSNTCYSFTDPERAVSITGVYSNAGQKLTSIPNAGGTSPLNASEVDKVAEGKQARDWFQSITYNAFGDTQG